MKLIFPHVPKVGGSSIRDALKMELGDKLLLDYEFPPIAHPLEDRKNGWINKKKVISNSKDEISRKYDVIYGHFNIDTYSSIAGFGKAIFFRDPVNRLFSNYYYVRSKKEPGDIGYPQDISEFCERVTMRSTYSLYIGMNSLDDFAFIGILEEFEKSIELFKRVSGIELKALHSRKGTKKSYSELLSDASLMPKLRRTQYVNYLIYEKAIERFSLLCKEFGL